MDIRLHIGAHRTGTSRVQAELMRRADHLVTRGVIVLRPEDLRDADAPPGQERGLLGWLNRPDDLAPLIARRDAAMAHGAQSLVVSEENLSGTITRILESGRIYGEIRQRMTRLRPLGQGHRVTVLFTVRRYDSFFASLYAFRAIREPMLPFQSFKPRFMALPIRWPQVVAQIARALPEANIDVIPFETAHNHATALLRQVLGLDQIVEVSDGSRPILPSPSGQAITILNSMTEGEDLELERRRAVVRAYPRTDFGAFAPWDTNEATALSKAYDEDLEALRLSPPPNTRLLDLSTVEAVDAG